MNFLIFINLIKKVNIIIKYNIKYTFKKIRELNYMFSNCLSLINMNILNFNSNKVINMEDMFFEYLILILIVLLIRRVCSKDVIV